jgi:hypothetical protein
MLHARYIYLTKAKPTHKIQSHPLVRGHYIRTMRVRIQLNKKENTLVSILQGLGAKTN